MLIATIVTCNVSCIPTNWPCLKQQHTISSTFIVSTMIRGFIQWQSMLDISILFVTLFYMTQIVVQDFRQIPMPGYFCLVKHTSYFKRMVPLSERDNWSPWFLINLTVWFLYIVSILPWYVGMLCKDMIFSKMKRVIPLRSLPFDIFELTTCGKGISVIHRPVLYQSPLFSFCVSRLE